MSARYRKRVVILPNPAVEILPYSIKRTESGEAPARSASAGLLSQLAVVRKLSLLKLGRGYCHARLKYWKAGDHRRPHIESKKKEEDLTVRLSSGPQARECFRVEVLAKIMRICRLTR